MSSPYHKLTDPNARPLENTIKFLQTDASGKTEFIPVNAESVSLSPDGSVDRFPVAIRASCGHTLEDGVGLQCGIPDCVNLSCKKCAQGARCSVCHVPLCQRCLREASVESKTIPLCPPCHGAFSRKRRWKKLLRIVVSPFISQSEDKANE